jgi:alcohol dehydrogenase (cytochrome c)
MRMSGSAAFLGLALLPALAAAQGIENYSAVTDERLANPEPENWLMTKGNYQGWSYSPLDQITAENVADLQPVWAYSTGVDSGHEAPPIVNNGVMFISAPYNKVIALDAATGDLLWEYQRELPEDLAPLHNTNRGIALYGDTIYLATLDCFLVALNAKTGEVVWEKQIEDYGTGYYMTLAPLIADGNIMIGVSGGEFGVRGFLQAFDAETGNEVWKTYTIPGPGEPGHETWEGDDWKRGGASVWMTGNYDPETNLTYWGTGNGSPWFGDQRPGDNLYTSSTLAIDAGTGEIKGYFQHHWNDSWDWDEMNAPMLVPFEADGQQVQGLIKPSRNGYLYWLERGTEGINFVDATNYVEQNVFASIDPETGRPTYNEEHKPGTGKYAEFCPSLWGGKDWPYEAYNPNTGMIYIPANENHCGSLEGREQEYIAGQWWTGVDIPDIGFTVDPNADHYGELQAWDLNSREEVWTKTYPNTMNWGPVLTTGGNLVFLGGTNDRMFRAHDAQSGEQLWEFRTSSGIMAPPSSFEVDGKQYIGVVSGWGVDPAAQQSLMNELLETDVQVPQGGTVWVFALPDSQG